MLSGVAVDASNAALGAWLRLQSYATSDEIETAQLAGVRSWNERRWLIACQLSPSDVEDVVAAKLARWDGDDLVLEGFDQEGLDAVKARRVGGSLGGRPRKAPQTTSPKPEVSSPKTSPEPLSSPLPSLPSPPSPLPSEAPAGAEKSDHGVRLYCEFHRGGKSTVRKLPPGGPVSGCPECKHAVASKRRRSGELETVGELLTSNLPVRVREPAA